MDNKPATACKVNFYHSVTTFEETIYSHSVSGNMNEWIDGGIDFFCFLIRNRVYIQKTRHTHKRKDGK